MHCRISFRRKDKTASDTVALEESGACDFAGIGRQHIADPEWIKKTKEGRIATSIFDGYTAARGYDPAV